MTPGPREEHVMSELIRYIIRIETFIHRIPSVNKALRTITMLAGQYVVFHSLYPAFPAIRRVVGGGRMCKHLEPRTVEHPNLHAWYSPL